VTLQIFYRNSPSILDLYITRHPRKRHAVSGCWFSSPPRVFASGLLTHVTDPRQG